MRNCLFFSLDLLNLGLLLRGRRLFLDFSLRLFDDDNIIFNVFFLDVLTVLLVNISLGSGEEDFFVFFLFSLFLLISHDCPEMIFIVIEKYGHFVNLLVIKYKLLMGLLFLNFLLLFKLLIHIQTIFIFCV